MLVTVVASLVPTGDRRAKPCQTHPDPFHPTTRASAGLLTAAASITASVFR